MFQIGDTVVYGNWGVCCIEDVREETFGPVRQEYYVLQPKSDPHSTFYCPIAQGASKLRRLLTADEVRALIRQMPQTEAAWVAEDAQRRERFAAILKSGDHIQVIQLIKTLYLQQAERAAVGKRLHLADERVLHEAERMLHEEFAQVLDISPSEVVGYIKEELGE